MAPGEIVTFMNEGKWRSKGEGVFSLYVREPGFKLKTDSETLTSANSPLQFFPRSHRGYLSFRVTGLWSSGRLAALQSSDPLSARILNFVERWIHPGLVQTCLAIKNSPPLEAVHSPRDNSDHLKFIFWTFFFFFCHIIWYVRSPFPDQILNPGNGSKSPESSPLDHQGTPWSSS